MANTDILKELSSQIENNPELSQTDKQRLHNNILKLSEQKMNILITGATGCGKSSTINALFMKEQATVGTDPTPETMDINYYELENLIIWDSPGLGDGKEADERHAKNIIKLLTEKDKKDTSKYLIDLVLVILDGSTRDLGTSYDLINNVIIPYIGNSKRILVAVNQADAAMKGKYWNEKTCLPEPQLIEFLDKKVESIKKRIKEATKVSVSPIYYSAGYKEPGLPQSPPYNISKLMYYIISNTPKEKRLIVRTQVNTTSWHTTTQSSKEKDYKKETDKQVKQGFLDSVIDGIEDGAEIGHTILGPVGKVVGGIIGCIGGAVKGSCYITTAVCESMGKADNCYELTMFRHFRDNWLIYQPEGIQLVTEYYSIAPKIVDWIESSPNRMNVYNTIRQQYLLDCLKHIEKQNYESCKTKYIEMVRYLQTIMNSAEC